MIIIFLFYFDPTQVSNCAETVTIASVPTTHWEVLSCGFDASVREFKIRIRK